VNIVPSGTLQTPASFDIDPDERLRRAIEDYMGPREPSSRSPEETVERSPAKAKRKRRSQRVAGRGKTPPNTCRYDYHGSLWESTSKLVRYADDMTGGGTSKSGRFFFGSNRSTAKILKMSTDTVGRAFDQAKAEGIFKIPDDPKDEWSKFGSRNYVFVTHDEWVEENGDGQCERCSDDRHTQDS
jgi:hypothetical protein